MTIKALPTTEKVELINKKEFVKVAFNENIRAFVVHVSFLSLRSKMTIYLARKVRIVLLLVKKVIVSAKYLDFADVFLEESTNILL